MALETKTPFLVLILSFFFFAFLSPCSCECKFTANECTKIQGMFVFGSSLVDNGNNNFLVNSLAKANYLPYGIDIPLLGPSGRFTNGKNVIDIIGEHLKLPVYIPNFNDPETKGSKIVNGVNFASGGSGILDNTGAVAGEVISLNKQIRNFENVTLPELEQQLSCKSNESLKDYLFVVGSGGNDYSLNYFLGLTNSNVSLQDFTANLTTTLSHQLKRLYNMGARKIVLMALYPNGCSPMARARNPMTTAGCVESLNRAALLFNVNLRSLVDSMRLEMPGSKLVFVNAYKVIMDILQNPTPKELEQQLSCKSNESLKDYLFVVGSGGNDYSLNYFLGLTNSNVSLQDFTANLTTTLSHQLKRLYNMGARKIVLMALYPNGCSPMARARNPMTTAGCVESLNRAALLFNVNLRSLVDSMRLEMPGSKLVFVNAYKVIMDILQNPTPKGFGDTKNPCCEVGGTGTLCKMGGNVCSKRNEYVYFDGLHPTEAVNIVLANKAFASNLKAEVYPTNVKLLSQV